MDINRVYFSKPALTFCSCTSVELCARLCSSQHLLCLSDKDRRNLERRFNIASDATPKDLGSGIVPVIVNTLNWNVNYQKSLMPGLIAFEFSYDEFAAIDFD